MPSDQNVPQTPSGEVEYVSAFPAFNQPQTDAMMESLSGTDTDTESDEDETTVPQETPDTAQDIYWAYRGHKRLWRRLSHKPTRKVRRFVKKRRGKHGGSGSRASAYFQGGNAPARQSSNKGLRDKLAL